MKWKYYNITERKCYSRPSQEGRGLKWDAIAALSDGLASSLARGTWIEICGHFFFALHAAVVPRKRDVD